MMRQTRVPPNVTRSTKLQGIQYSPELALRTMDFHVPENLIFPALENVPTEVNKGPEVYIYV